MRDNNLLTIRPATQMRQSKFLMCHLCGGEYGTASLAIHQKACVQKQAMKSNRRNGKEKPAFETKINEALEAMKNNKIGIDEYNQISAEYYENTAVDRGEKLPCHNCGRTFARAEGLEKHMVLCVKETLNKGGIFARKHKRETTISSIPKEEKEMKQKNPIETITPRSEKGFKYCTECGENFAQYSTANKWKFCPSCGTKIVFI